MEKYSFLNAAHTSYFAEMYDRYLQNPDEIEPSWKAFFQGFDFGVENSNGLNGEKTLQEEVPEHLQKEFKVIQLIDSYRKRGHLFTKTNPVRERRKYSPTLALENFGLTKDDLNIVFNAGDIIGIGPSTLSKIVGVLEQIYCDSIGVEYMYIRNPERVDWMQRKLRENQNHGNFSKDKKRHILKKLNQAVTFENFLHTKYVGQKRFSLEGGEALIPALDEMVELAAENGVKEFVMGMAHRGRLNTLINIFGKSARDVFSEFEGKDYSDEMIFDGDVKYHLGWTVNRKTRSGNSINMNLAPNPSHLETVGAIVQGITRAKIDNNYQGDSSKALPIIVHGDAAIAGQGLPYEIVQMARLDGYTNGGTIHIVVNNQIGFTTNYLDARSSTYCTDVAKVTLCPVFHVNSDDVEAVVHASKIALEYRTRFKRDVFIDLLGYRKYGHNEGDEPRFTQPNLYKLIAKHKNPSQIYSQKLLDEKIIDEEYFSKLKTDYRDKLDYDYENAKKVEKTTINLFLESDWINFKKAKSEDLKLDTVTKVKMKVIEEVANSITTLPAEKKILRKTVKLINERKKMFSDGIAIDWGLAEMLAYGTLLFEGHNVRISGQDVQRGTFSHRHAIIKSDDSEEEIVLLNNVPKKNNTTFSIYNSPLSEYAVLGFDYGYAMASPNTLTIWEAQFGDFSNGAQIIIDQYISAAEDKWKLPNGIVLFLPHGYEGQGAEHSSARMERFLQLCGDDNMILANCTSPSNFFHLLRRQIKSSYRKPLVVFTPKSLLRHPMVTSNLKDFTEGKFKRVISENLKDVNKIKTLIFCTGKFYFDILTERNKIKRYDTAIIRVEQIFPLPTDELNLEIKKYKNVKDLVWAQEEPKNMGAWSYLLLHYDKAKLFRVASRPFSDSPASGSTARFNKRHRKVLSEIFKSK
ncbi:MAG: 2-oxoglutarate dehydrogenase E1 component [Bacteroidota bacterium]|nr:2-oxoglutarate dehydrogenase E1 component [Bacteroidota bacterium]